MNKLFVLDVSGFLFRAYFALPSMTNARGESTNALYGFIRSVLKLMKEFSPDHLVAVFDGPDNKNQRTNNNADYKAHRVRDNEDLPEQIERARTFCTAFGIPYLEVPGVEADDTMGSIAQWAASLGSEVFLCTADKDLCQLVDEHIKVLNTWKNNLILDAQKVEEIYGVPPSQIIDLLAIMGDSSDNIPGIKGFGPKTAVALLKEFGSLKNLLAHPEKVTSLKKQQTIKENTELALLSQQLATIHVGVEFPQDKTFFSLKKPDRAKLKEFYLDMNFSSLARELDELMGAPQQEEVEYALVDDLPSLEALAAKIQNAAEVCFDLRSTHVRPLLAQPVGIGFCFKEAEAFYVPLNGQLGKQKVLETLKPLFENPKIGFFGHNAKYDRHVLANVGISIANLTFDTILASYLLNSSSGRHTLDHLSLHYFGKVKTPIKTLISSGKKEITMDLVPIENVSDYCCENVDYTFRIKLILAEELKKRKLEKLLFDIELPLSTVLMEMEREGMFLEVGELKILETEVLKELRAVESEIFDLAGEEFNISSPKQLSKILFEKLAIKPLKKTVTGLSTKAEVLEELALEYPIAAKILIFRSLDKLRSTYIETLPLEVNPQTGRIHPTFNQFIAATGRLACQDPNLQNIPVRAPLGRKIRAAFRPQKQGWSYVSADYSQVELRLVAHLSGDPGLIEAFKTGQDIHTFTASQVFNIPLTQVSREQRHRAKAINFGIIYGQQAYGLSREIGITVKEAVAFIEAYFERYPKVAEFISQCIEKTGQSKKAVTLIGREREIPDIHNKNTLIRQAAERLAINTPLQGAAADLIKLAMLEMHCQISKKQLHAKMTLQIHDELIFEAPDDELDVLVPLVKQVMEGIFSLKVPLIVDVSIGKNWAEC